MYMYICTYMYTMYMYTFLHTYMYMVHTYMYMYIHTCIWCTHIHVHVHTCIIQCHTHTCTCTCIWCTYIHTSLKSCSMLSSSQVLVVCSLSSNCPPLYPLSNGGDFSFTFRTFLNIMEGLFLGSVSECGTGLGTLERGVNETGLGLFGAGG